MKREPDMVLLTSRRKGWHGWHTHAGGLEHRGLETYKKKWKHENMVYFEFNTLSAKDGDLRLSASNACLPKTEISVFVTECVFFTSTCYKLCSHCMMCYTFRTKKCSSLFWYKAIIVWFSQFITTVVQN